MNTDIKEFLKILTGNIEIHFTNKALVEMRSNGFTIIDAKEELRMLRLNHYIRGPELSDEIKFLGTIWTFKKNINNKVYYIKLYYENEIKLIRCISFHVDAYK